LEVRADNIACLTMMRKLRVKGRGLTRISQELALLIARGTYEPAICDHTPGIQNVLADDLSRKFQPEKAASWTIPAQLANCTQVPSARRGISWWKCRPAAR